MPHILDTYAMMCGLKHSKPNISEMYFPIPTNNKYITIHNSSKTPSKEYDYFDEVVLLIKPILEKNNIDIIQIGDKSDKIIQNTIQLNGKTSIRQTSFIINKSLLHLGVDSAPIHIASVFSKKIVGLYSNNYINCVKPYWTKNEDCILLEPDRNGYKPNFSLNEFPKTINKIYPEIIAKSVLKLLNLPFNYEFKTISIGQLYPNKILESALTDLVDVKRLGAQNLILRYDINANITILNKQLELNPCQIVTNVELPIKSLLERRQNVLGLIVKVTSNLNPNFIKTLIENKISYQLISELSIEELNSLKLSYMDYGIITRINSDCPEKLKDKKLSDIYFKSGKLLLASGKFFSSHYEYLNNNPILNPTKVVPHQINSNNVEILWKESEHMIFLEKNIDKTS